MVFATIFLSLALMTSLVSVNLGSAFADKQENPNAFGKGASELGRSGEMGEHASRQDEPRLSIGNVGEALCEDKLKPGESASVLNGGGYP